MKKYKKHLIISLLVLVGIALIFSGISFAKYVSNSVWDYYLQSKGFYISSDHLSEEPVKNIDNLWDGGSVKFNIKNSLNDKVVTMYDIGYKVECSVQGDNSSDINCYLNGSLSNEQEGVLSNFQTCVNHIDEGVDVSSFNKTDCELNGYEWVNQKAVQDLYFDVIPKTEEVDLTDVVVNVKVTSTYPYKKTISGDFLLHKRNYEEESVTMGYRNYSNYDRLIVSNSFAEDKCVNITWDPSKIVIDADESDFISYLVDGNNYISGIKVNVLGKGSKSYIFYKKDFTKIYNVNEFTLNEC